jgi:hypothetical protein
MNEKTKDMLAALSPAYGIATGRGMFGKMADKGFLGIGARALANSGQQREEEKVRQQQLMQQGIAAAPAVQAATAQPMAKMKGGGKVSSASKRADGCVSKGKTKGRMI